MRRVQTPDAPATAVAELRRVLGDRLSGAAVLFDFDGSLAPIVVDPAAAAPTPGAVELLDDLAAAGATVAVVSGRPVSFLADHVGSGIALSGLYGIERRVDGVVSAHPQAARWRTVIASVDGSDLPDGVVVEPKGVSMTVHFRAVPDAADTVVAWANRVAAETDLEVRSAKASVELHPPIEADKGAAVKAFADRCDPVVYVGDDVGDLPAFAALRDLAADGVQTLGVVVGSDELADDVRAAADVIVDGPVAVVQAFRAVLGPA